MQSLQLSHPSDTAAHQEGSNIYLSLKELALKRKIPFGDLEHKLITITLTLSTHEIVGEGYRIVCRIPDGEHNDFVRVSLGIHNYLLISTCVDGLAYTEAQLVPGHKAVLKVTFLGDNVAYYLDGSLVHQWRVPAGVLMYLAKTVLTLGGHDCTQDYYYELFKGIIYTATVSVQDPTAIPAELGPLKAQTITKMQTEFNFLSSLVELYFFDSTYLGHMVSKVSLRQRGKSQKKAGSKHKLLVCHDAPGFICEDQHVYGDFGRSHGYRFHFWGSCDIFCYFFHRIVVIPPPGYVLAAHRAGAKIIGSLVFEDEESLNHLLQDELPIGYEVRPLQKDFFYAEKLVEVCATYGFDGYLLNLEAPVKRSLVPRLLDWIVYLRSRLLKINPHAEVVWYDALIETGEVQWQSQLNELNQIFFRVSDAFFIDYSWNPSDLPRSLAFLADRSPLDVYVGNDIYGRNVSVGGELDTYKGTLPFLLVTAIHCSYTLT